VWRYRGQAIVDGILVAQAEFSAAIVEAGAQSNVVASATQVAMHSVAGGEP